ncbi:MAG: sulfotransferase family protein [Dehalococcoidia bacterium]
MIRAVHHAWRRIRYGEPVIVVSGLPRSGTSLMMQMLEAGGVPIVTDRTRTADESNPRGYYELERVKALEHGADTSWLGDASGKAVKVVAYLLEHLPAGYNYRVVFMQRRLDEVLASQRRMLELSGEPAGADDARMREMLVGHIARTRRLLARRPGFETLYVRHGDVLAEPLVKAREVAAFLRRALDVNAMATVVDRALHRSRGDA